MNKLLLASIFVLLLASSAFATVMPPPEWFEIEGNAELWQEMWPTLDELEFGESNPQSGPGVTTSADIRAQLGKSTSAADNAGIRSLDLNLDGVIDHFDLLELGYEVPRVTKSTSIAPSEGTAQWCVLRADFQDESANYETYDAPYFNERFFSYGTAPLPSVNDFYQETSYGKLEIQGAVATSGVGGDGWHKGANTKQWYIDNGGRVLVQEAVLNADPDVDFSQFDVDGDGYVDTVLLYYPNTVFSGGLWPHRSSGLNIHVDGVIVDSYFISGYNADNDSHTMVIAAHEYGHILGLPDLYDTDYSSNGIARWSLMANNYDNSQRVPSPDPWCKVQLGWVTPTVITENVNDYPLNAYETHPEVLKVWTNGQQEDQYFLIANIQRILTDQTRPGDGLLVLHCDDSRSNNRDEYRKWVDVESARGVDDTNGTEQRDPIDNGNSGHPDDLYFAGNGDANFTGEFSNISNPRSSNYPNPGNQTFVRLYDISASAATMTLDINVKSVNAPSVSITSHAENDNVGGIINVTADATPDGSRTIARVEFYLNGAFFGSDDTAPYELSLNTAPVYNGSRPLKAIAVDSADEIATDSLNVNVSNSPDSYPWFDDFETGIGNWASYNFGGTRFWELKNTGSNGSFSAGVGSESGGYDRNEHDLLVSPLIDLAGATAPLLRWYQRYRVSSGENTCKLLITTDEGLSFTTLASFTGTNTSWHITNVDFSPYIGQQFRLAYRLDSSSISRIGNGVAGFWVDDIALKEQSTPPTIDSITPGDGGVLSWVETIEVVASDDEGIVAVDFIVDGQSIGVDNTDPFQTDWYSGVEFDKALPFTAVAYDTDGQQAQLTVNWTTSNPGLPLPWSEGWEGAITPFYQLYNVNGRGNWHTRGGQGYAGTKAMFFGRNSDNYGANQSDTLITPTLLLDGVSHPGLGYLHHYDIENGYDFCQVYVTTDLNTWSELASYTGEDQTDWRSGGVSLDPWLGESVKLAWYFTSDNNVHGDGYWLDDLVLRESPHIDNVSPEHLLEGDPFTVTGTNFGEDIPGEFASVLVGGMAALVTSWSETSIEATVPAGAPGGAIVVTSHGVPSNAFQVRVVLPAPTLTDIGTAEN